MDGHRSYWLVLRRTVFLTSIDPMPIAYTASTAGEQGFLQLLPIYLDHILYPTMTKASFLTEVGGFFNAVLPRYADTTLGSPH